MIDMELYLLSWGNNNNIGWHANEKANGAFSIMGTKISIININWLLALRIIISNSFCTNLNQIG